MKRIIPVLLIIVSAYNTLLFSQYSENALQLPDYPSYKAAVSGFLEDYSISDIPYPNQFYFAKEPDGWHATIYNRINEEIVKDELYWNRDTRKYRIVDFPKAESNISEDNSQNIIDDWSNNYFTKILPYWGYVGWDKDVIDEYANKSNLSDTLLNALARAYCSYASNLLNNNTGVQESI